MESSSASSGGALTFGGLNSVLLTTQKGSIILGGGISFQNIPESLFYARGDNVALNLASPISDASSNLLLNSEGTVQVNGNVTVDNFKRMFSERRFPAGQRDCHSAGRDHQFHWRECRIRSQQIR